MVYTGSRGNVPSKEDFLLKMAELQPRAFHQMLAAQQAKESGDLAAARDEFESLRAMQWTLLDIGVRHNRHHQPPFDIPPLAEPLVNTLMILADIEEALGRATESEHRRNEALAVGREHLTDTQNIEAERSRAASLIAQARFNEALVSLTKVQDYYHAQGDALREARVAIDLADLLHWLNDHARARDALDRAKQSVAERLGRADDIRAASTRMDDPRAMVDAVELLRISKELDYYAGLIAKDSGRLDEAEACFQRVLPFYRDELGVGPAIEYQLVKVSMAKGDLAKALEGFKRLEPAMRRGLLRPKLGIVLKDQAETLLRLGRAREARTLIEEALRELKPFHQPDLEWKAHWVDGRIRRALHDPSATGAFARAVEIVNGMRKAPLGYRLDSAFLADKLPLFEDAVRAAEAAGDGAACCRFIELVKSRTLATVLGVPGERAPAGPLEARLDAVTRDIEAAEFRTYRGETTDDADLRRKLAERADLIERIRFSDPRWRALDAPVAVDVEAIASTLAALDAAALTLFYRGGRVTTVLIESGAFRVGSMDLTTAARDALAEYHANLRRGEDARIDEHFDPSTLPLAADALIPAALLEDALSHRRLMVVPHGDLHVLPWPGMPYRGRRLFERCAVGIAPSLSWVAAVASGAAPPAGVKAALIGAPTNRQASALDLLEGAGHELRDIAADYGRASRLIGAPVTGEAATVAAFWRLYEDPAAAGTVLHVACHGTFEEAEPMRSALVLEDGSVDAAELARRRTTLAEIVLSSCSTGYRPSSVSGRPLDADEILGLPAALLEAGVDTVVVSIPPVWDDVAPVVMKRYHDERRGGADPLDAFRRAQMAMLHDGGAPHEWIGFVVFGCR